MNTRLTVADVRAQLWQLADPNDINSPKFLQMLNEVSEKLIYSGKWKGSTIQISFDSSSGFITLPAEHYSVMAMTYNRCPGRTFTQYHGYQENGPGNLKDTLHWPGILLEVGDGFVTQTDIPSGTSGTLRITLSNAADATKEFRLYGTDASNNVIYDLATGVEGVPVTGANPTVDTTQVFGNVTGIQAPDGLKGTWTLSYVVAGVPTQIGAYYPWETRPMYTRYQTGVAEKTIRILCQRRFRLMKAETDWVIPGNLAALKEAFRSLNYLDGSDDEKAAACFNRALFWLNNEAKAFRAGASTPMNFDLWGINAGNGYTSQDY